MNGQTSRAMLYWINALICTLGILVIGFASYALADPDNIGSFLTVSLPNAAFIGCLIFAVFLVFVSGLGLCGSKTDNKLGLGLYIFITLCVLIAQVAGFILILNKYGILSDAKLNQANAEVLQLETAFVKTCVDNPNDWVKVQNTLKCCGYDANYGRDNIATLDTGKECLGAVAEGVIYLASAGMSPANQNAAFNTAYAANGGSGEYFCKQTMIASAENYALSVGVTAGVLALLQIIGLVAASRLACCISVKEGGYMEEWRPSTRDDEYTGVNIAGTGAPITSQNV